MCVRVCVHVCVFGFFSVFTTVFFLYFQRGRLLYSYSRIMFLFAFHFLLDCAFVRLIPIFIKRFYKFYVKLMHFYLYEFPGDELEYFQRFYA